MINPEDRNRIIAVLLQNGWQVGVFLDDAYGLIVRKPTLPLVDCYLSKVTWSEKRQSFRLQLASPSYHWTGFSHVLAYLDTTLWLIPLEALPKSGETLLGKKYDIYRICIQGSMLPRGRDEELSSAALDLAKELERA